jgi:dihydroorotase-like cyclic amidohydrolase
MPAFRGDVDIRNGKIVEMGKRRGSATPAIEVDGLGVAPDVVGWERTVW